MFKQRVVFVHGAGSFGSAAWPRQHGMALQYDALFLRRHGFDAEAEPLETDFAEDARIVLRSLADDGRGGAGGHIVAHAQGAIAAMMAAVERPDLVFSLTLVEQARLSLTAELPATAAHRALMEPLFEVRHQLGDDDYEREFLRRAFAAEGHAPSTPEASAPRGGCGCRHRPGRRRCRLFRAFPLWFSRAAGSPSMRKSPVTCGTGALHRTAAEDTGPRHSAEGDRLIRSFIAEVSRRQQPQAS